MYTYSLVLDDVYWSRGYNRILTFSGCRQQETQCSYTAQHPCSRQLWHSKRTAWSVSQHPDDKTRPNGHTYPGYTPHMTNVQLHQCAIRVSYPAHRQSDEDPELNSCISWDWKRSQWPPSWTWALWEYGHVQTHEPTVTHMEHVCMNPHMYHNRSGL